MHHIIFYALHNVVVMNINTRIVYHTMHDRAFGFPGKYFFPYIANLITDTSEHECRIGCLMPSSLCFPPGLVCMKSSTSVVELVMLLCSQVNLFFTLLHYAFCTLLLSNREQTSYS